VDNDQYIRNKVFDFFLIFASIFYEALPFIVLGAVIAGILQEFLPQRLVTRFLPRNRTLAIAIGALLGLIFPMCECGIIPVMRRLMRKGFPLSCCVAYLLAGPVINIVVIFSTAVAFTGMENVTVGGRPAYQMGSLWMTGLRVGLAYLVAVGTALIVERQHRIHGDKLLTPLTMPGRLSTVEDENGVAHGSWSRSLSNVSETALHDFIDITVYLILGALLAAFVRVWLTPEMIANWTSGHPMLASIVMMLFAYVISLCSEADAFVAASFVTMRPAAKLAFLVFGPMMDIKLTMMYTRVFRPRLIWTIILSVAVQVFVYSYIVHLLWEHYAPLYFTSVVPPLPGS